MLNVHLCTVSLPRSVPTPSPCYSLPIARGEINSPRLMLFPTQLPQMTISSTPPADLQTPVSENKGGQALPLAMP